MEHGAWTTMEREVLKKKYLSLLCRAFVLDLTDKNFWHCFFIHAMKSHFPTRPARALCAFECSNSFVLLLVFDEPIMMGIMLKWYINCSTLSVCCVDGVEADNVDALWCALCMNSERWTTCTATTTSAGSQRYASSTTHLHVVSCAYTAGIWCAWQKVDSRILIRTIRMVISIEKTQTHIGKYAKPRTERTHKICGA